MSVIIARVSSKGQITLPIDARRRLGIKANSRVEIITGDGCIIIRPLRSVRELAGILPLRAKGAPMDWERARTEAEQAVAREVAEEGAPGGRSPSTPT